VLVVLDRLVQMSNALGEPAQAYVILGEGNTLTRARADEAYFRFNVSDISFNSSDTGPEEPYRRRKLAGTRKRGGAK
jgi:hypothetical protein